MAAKKTKALGLGRPHSMPTEKRNVTEEVSPLVSFDQLRKENEELRRQLTETQQLMAQLLSEAPNENYGQRRVMLLKAQLYQTERQLLLLQDGMARRTGALWEAENILKNVKSQCQSYATSDSHALGKSTSDVSVPRSQFFRLVEEVEKARSALFRRLQREEETGSAEQQRTYIPNRFMAVDATKRGQNPEENDKRGDLIDLLTGKQPMLNLEKMSGLETEIFSCYEEVMRLATILRSSSSSSSHVDEGSKPSPMQHFFSFHESPSVVERLSRQTKLTKERLERLGNCLIESSLLVPLSARTTASSEKNRNSTTSSFLSSSSSSSSPGANPVLNPIDAKTILAKFPKQTIAKSRLKDVTTVLQSFADICEKQRSVDALNNGILREELDDLTDLLKIQNDYVREVIEMAGKSYDEFCTDLTRQFRAPIGRLIDSYDNMEAEPTEENLRLFLLAFKENYGAVLALREFFRQWEDSRESRVIPMVDPFSIVQNDFSEKIDAGLRELNQKRDSRIAEMMLGRRSELENARTTFSNLCVAG